MNHAITVGGLLLGLAAFVGFVLLAIGVVKWAASSMSAAPSEFGDMARDGCISAVIGAVFFIGGVWGLLS